MQPRFVVTSTEYSHQGTHLVDMGNYSYGQAGRHVATFKDEAWAHRVAGFLNNAQSEATAPQPTAAQVAASAAKLGTAVPPKSRPRSRPRHAKR